MAEVKNINGYDLKDYQLEALQVNANQGKFINISNTNQLIATTIDKSYLGLSNVDNTSDATKKTNYTGSIASGNTGFITGGDVYTSLSNKSDSNHTHNYAGSTSAGGAANTVARATFGDSSNGTHDANNIDTNGLWYYTSNGPATSIGASTSDGALYSQAYSSSWVGQIAQDYRNGNLFVRGKNNGTWQSWQKIAVDGHTHSYAASTSAGGPATTAISTADSSTTTVYLTGVAAANGELKYNTNIYMNCSTGVIMGAAWNDFAEGRACTEEAGTCVAETGNGQLIKTTDYCQLGCAIVSDTYGMLIGAKEYDEGAPIAVAGRVLAKFDATKGEAKPGMAVMSAPNGCVAIMDRNLIKEWPDAIIGYVSEIPTYEEWNGRKINGRIWIKVK